MAEVFIELPSLLRQVLESESDEIDLRVEADTLNELLEKLRQQHPKLAVHLFDELSNFRPHVLCFLNGKNLRWMKDYSQSLNSGDRLLIMQAVSGG